MTTNSPFDVAQKFSKNFAPVVTQAQDTRAIDEILQQASQQEPEKFNDLISEIISRVSPNNQKSAMSLLENKKNEIFAPARLKKRQTAYQDAGIPVGLAGLEDEERKSAVGSFLKRQETLHDEASKAKQSRANELRSKKGLLKIIQDQKDRQKTGYLGGSPSIVPGHTGRKIYSPIIGKANEVRAAYEQTGKFLISEASRLNIRNKDEFLILGEKLYDPKLTNEEIKGIWDSMEKTIMFDISQDELGDSNSKVTDPRDSAIQEEMPSLLEIFE